MKHTRLLSAFLAFLLSVTVQIYAQGTMREVKGYAGVSPLPKEMKQGDVAFTYPVPRYIKFIKGIAGKGAVRQYADLIPQQKEGYYLYIGSNEIVLAGRDEDGLYYAEKTLEQLLYKGGDISETEIRDWPSVECRGSIEGFYGNPWSHKDRIRQFQFYGKNKMNTYVYGPKDDPYHRRHWREPYPAEEAKKLAELVREAKKNHVQFVWAIHPGLDIQWNKKDSMAIVKKLESVYSLGVRTFAVFFDDISGEGTQADKQAGLMNYITQKFVWKHKDVNPLIICPTQYNKGWSHGDYLSTLGWIMYPEIRIMWTGNSVVDMIEKNDMEWINQQIRRKAFIWLNYPVNDYCQSRMLMGKTYGNGLDIADMLSGFCSNPMEYAEASKVSLYSIADYTWNTEAYDAPSSWESALKDIMPGCTDAFKVFCENNVDLGVTGHGLRREGESPKFKPFLDKINEITKLSEQQSNLLSDKKLLTASEIRKHKAQEGYKATEGLCQEMNFDSLRKYFKELVHASHVLMSDTIRHPELIKELEPWIKAMYYTGIRGINVTEEAEALLKKDDINFIFTYNNYRAYEQEQKKLISRDYEGSIVKAKPAFSGDVVTPLVKALSDTLIALYKMQYTEHWDVFPTGILPDGDYFIIYDGKILTDSLASPTRTGDFPVFLADRDYINPQRQLWHFAYNEKTETYSITNVQDGRYINEIGNFWRDMNVNPYDPQYHSFLIEKADDKFSIKQTGRGGNSYWRSNGRRITTGNGKDNNVFQIISKEEYDKF